MAAINVLVSLQCTVKIYFPANFPPPNQHSCRFSVGTIAGRAGSSRSPYIQLEGLGVPRKLLKLSSGFIASIAAQRVEDGRLTVNFAPGACPWDMLMLSNVASIPDLRRCHSVLEKIHSGQFLSEDGREGTDSHHRTVPSARAGTGHHRPPPGLLQGHSPSPSRRKKPALYRTYGTKAAGGNTPAFYKRGPAITPVSEPFLPSSCPPTNTPYTSTPSHSTSSGGYFNKSSRRSLAFDLPVENSRKEDDDDDVFQKDMNYRQQRPVAGSDRTGRAPLAELTDLTDHRSDISSRVRTLLQQRDEDVEGFANLGNTCYMNAVLQSLLGLDSFAEDLLNYRLVNNVHPQSLYRMLCLLLKSKRAKDPYESQKVLLKRIKGVISVQAAKFSGFRQQDAHELLGQCLDQLRDDAEHIAMPTSDPKHTNSVSEAVSSTACERLCPVVRNFESGVLRAITCKECGKHSERPEVVYDFALQLPKSVILKPIEQANLQQLFNMYFSSEDVEYTCSGCHGNSAILSHQLSRLPRVLILHLKRYRYNTRLSLDSKRVDNIRIPRFINVGHLCVKTAHSPFEFKGQWPKDPDALSTLSSRDDKENLPRPQPGRDEAVTVPQTSSSPTSSDQNPPTPGLNGRPVVEPISPPETTDPVHHTALPDRHPTRATSPEVTILDVCEPVRCESSSTATPSASRPHGCQPVARVVSTDPHDGYPTARESSSKSLLGKRERLAVGECSADPSHSRENAPRTAGKETPPTKRRSASQMIVDDFDTLFKSPEIVFEFDPPDRQSAISPSTSIAVSHHPGVTTSERGKDLPPPTSIPVNGAEQTTRACDLPCEPLDDAGGLGQEKSIPVNGADQTTRARELLCDPLDNAGGLGQEEEEDIKRAMEESMKTQPSQVQLLHQLGLSEEEQFRLALELSMQEASAPEPAGTPPSRKTEIAGTPTPEASPKETYRLVSIVSHLGRGAGGGHYISDVYCWREDVWKSFNDSTVTEYREEDIRQRRQASGYLFFYMHKSTYNSIRKYLKH